MISDHEQKVKITHSCRSVQHPAQQCNDHHCRQPDHSCTTVGVMVSKAAIHTTWRAWDLHLELRGRGHLQPSLEGEEGGGSSETRDR